MINPLFNMRAMRSDAGTTTTAAGAAARASSKATAAERSVRELEDKLDKLSLICMAMWSLIQDRTNLKEEDLMERVRTLDLMDGVADGKATKTVSKCPKCQRVMSPRHNRCLYCGYEHLVRSAFDQL